MIVMMWVAIIYMHTHIDSNSFGVYAGNGSIWPTIDECNVEGPTIVDSINYFAASIGATYSYECHTIPLSE